MRALLLSFATTESLSKIGFIILAIGLLGDVGVLLIPDKNLSHKLLVLGFAAIVLIGYLIGHIGDDEIAGRANAELDRIKSPRVITDSQYAAFVECLKPGPKGPVYVRRGMLDTDGPPLAKRIEAALKEAGFTPPSEPVPGGDALAWSKAGIFLIVRDLKNSPHGAQIQRCFKSAINWEIEGQADPKHPEDAVSIGIGPRLSVGASGD